MLADMRTEHRNRGIYINMLRLRAPRNAAIRPHRQLISVSLKELRSQSEYHVFRIAYIFDTERKGLLLTGGDKKGKNEKKFYKDMIREAEQIYAAYLEKKNQEKEK